MLAVEIEESIHASCGDKQVAFRLPAALTKGDKGRTIRIPATLLGRFRSYLAVERSVAAGKFKARGGGERRMLRLETVTPGERTEAQPSSISCRLP